MPIKTALGAYGLANYLMLSKSLLRSNDGAAKSHRKKTEKDGG
jgi:hypothetical protein